MTHLFQYFPGNSAGRICVCVPRKFYLSGFSRKNESVIAVKTKTYAPSLCFLAAPERCWGRFQSSI